jgi:hypothetical protein
MSNMLNPFVAHAIGDLILQTEWMAIKKRQSNLACLVHVLVYLIPFLFTGMVGWQLLLIGLLHFIQDRSGFVLWWMKKYKKVPQEHWAVIPLLVDQAFHLLEIELAILLVNVFPNTL